MSPEHTKDSFPDFPLADFQMHLLACKGVLSATPNAKDMTSDAWDCLKTRILGSLWLGLYDLMKGMKGFLAKRARLRVVEGVTKNAIYA